jgi:hypothetical protein
MPLPIGSWSATIAGEAAVLFITAVDSAGDVEGSGFGGLISGTFNEATQELSFIAVTSASNTNVSAFVYCHATLFSYKLKLGTSYLLAGDKSINFEERVNTSGAVGTWFAELYVAN